MRKHRISVLCILAISALGYMFLLLCDASEAAPKVARHLNMGLFWFGTDLDPANNWNGWTLTRSAIGENLVTVNEKMRFAPQLADSWETPDDLTWRFHIREGVTFHNGKRVTGEAVKRSIERSLRLNKRGETNLKLAKIEASGQFVTFRTKEPYGAFLANLSEPLFTIVDTTQAEDTFRDRPICTGPYRVKSFTKDVEIQAERYEKYWGGKPGLDTVTIRHIPDNDTRAMALQSGELDLVQRVAPGSLPLFESKSDFKTSKTIGIRVIYACLNTKNEFLGDAKIRQALSCALDRNIFAKVLGGGAFAADAPFPPSVPYGYKTLKRQTFDLKKAARLLKEAGFSVIGKGNTLERNGKKLELNLLAPNTGEIDYPTLAQALQSQLGNIGVKINIFLVENTAEKRAKGDFDIVLCNFATAATGDPQWFLEANYTTGGTENYGAYSNPKLDKVISQLSHTFGEKERANIAKEAQQIIIDEAVNLFLVSPANVDAFRSTVENVVTFPIDYYILTKNVSIR